jgi:curved DNA-binding protein CbpA
MASPSRDPYAILGVSRGASRAEIASAYRHLAKAAHPDLGATESDRMRDLNWAWELLDDPLRRAEWDRRTASAVAHWSAAGPSRWPPEPRAEPRTSRPSWAVSGDDWEGPGAPAVRRSANLGCAYPIVAAVALMIFVLVAALASSAAIPTP